MNVRSSRIYLRGSHRAFVITLAFLFAAAVLLIGLIQMPASSKLAFLFPTVLLFLTAYYIDKASMGWIQISGDGRELLRVPGWFAQKLLNEARVVARIEPGAEFIICRGIGYGFVNGFSIILRAPSGREQVIWETSQRETRRRLRHVGDQIAARHHLNVRFVSRSISEQGVEEKEWTTESGRAEWRRIGIPIIVMLTPFLGIAVRLITANLLVIVMVGAAVWLIECGFFSWWALRKVGTVKLVSVAGAILLWTMSFVTFYGLSVLVAGQVIVSHWFWHKL